MIRTYDAIIIGTGQAGPFPSRADFGVTNNGPVSVGAEIALLRMLCTLIRRSAMRA